MKTKPWVFFHTKMFCLAKSEPLVHLPWAVKGDMGKGKSAKIQQAMLDLGKTPAGKKILEAAKVTGFYQVENSDYDQIRKISEYALGETF